MADGDNGSGGAGGGTGAGGADPGASAWYSGKVDQETLGHWQNKGWNVADPAVVASEATKAWKAAEQAHLTLTGVPSERLLRIPLSGDEAGLKAFQQKLGAPIDAAGYDFSTVKRADGSAVDPNMTGPLALAFHRLGIPKDAATEIVKQVVAQSESVTAARGATDAAAVQAEQAALRANWGQNYEANKFVASQAAQKLGVTPAELDMLDGQIGHAKVMEMFRKVGTEMGEARFISSQGQAGNGVMTQEQAVARITELKKDEGFVKKYLAGDTAARNEMNALSRLKLGGVDESLRPTRMAR